MVEHCSIVLVGHAIDIEESEITYNCVMKRFQCHLAIHEHLPVKWLIILDTP